jgi:regulator of RNase E activity RraA
MPSPTERLRALDSCAVSDALDKLRLSGAVGGLRQLSSPRRIAGRVLTCRLVSAAAGKAVSQVMGADYEHLLHS